MSDTLNDTNFERSVWSIKYVPSGPELCKWASKTIELGIRYPTCWIIQFNDSLPFALENQQTKSSRAPVVIHGNITVHLAGYETWLQRNNSKIKQIVSPARSLSRPWLTVHLTYTSSTILYIFYFYCPFY